MGSRDVFIVYLSGKVMCNRHNINGRPGNIPVSLITS